jgi:hypothetical protein
LIAGPESVTPLVEKGGRPPNPGKRAVRSEIPWSEPVPDAVPAPPELTSDRVPVLQTDLLWDALDEMVDPAGVKEPFAEANAVVVTSLLATAGYVLLNTRAGFWLLSLLTAKPMWKDFDPLEVLYNWEVGGRTGGGAVADEDEETLLSLVG